MGESRFTCRISTPANRAQENYPQVALLKQVKGICEVYANVIHINWTAYDVRLRLGQLIADPRTSPQNAKWVVEEQAAITMAYGEAKYLRNLLHGIILDYEAKNGELKMPVLPAPPAPVEPK